MSIDSRAVYEAALRYASKGWMTLPLHSIRDGICTCTKANCESPGKHPRTKHGVLESSVQLATIEAWWRRWPDSNVGIATGTRSNLFVLDIDYRSAGDQSFQALEKTLGKLPATVEAISGNGRHLYFSSEDKAIKCSSNKLGNGLDTRTNGGYVVAPPSLHANGRHYAWEISSHPDEVKLAPLPSGLLALMPKNSAGYSKTTDSWRALLSKGAKEGSRNCTLTSLAGTLLRHGVNAYVAHDLLLAWNTARGKPPLSNDEVTRVVNSIANRELDRIKQKKQP